MKVAKEKIYLKPAGVIFLLAFALFLNSCEESPVIVDELPEIETVSAASTYYGDTLEIYGSNFGGHSQHNMVMFRDSLIVNSYDCIRWTNSLVQLEVPIGASSGTFAVVSDSVVSNRLEIEISPLPPLETVSIPAGSFIMGSAIGLDDELPVHEVTLTKAFEISKYEITYFFWHAVTREEGLTPQNKNLPIAGITWLEAVEFCNRVSDILGLEKAYDLDGEEVAFDEEANGYRLPNEAEWEYACRAGRPGDFGGAELGDAAWYVGNSGYKAHPVGRKQPNAFGIHDMLGNVREWCWDWYTENYYSASPEADPLGPASGERRVMRGGSYADGNSLCRATNRHYPDYTPEKCGLRLVRTIRE